LIGGIGPAARRLVPRPRHRTLTEKVEVTFALPDGVRAHLLLPTSLHEVDPRILPIFEVRRF